MFHGDGERFAFQSDGRVFYERMRRGKLLRWEGKLDAVAELRAVAARLASAAPVVPSRPGVPDEVSIQIHFRDPSGDLQRVDVWADDVGKLPPGHVVHDVRGAVARAADALTSAGQGAPHAPDDAGRRWPHVFGPAR